MARSFHTTRYLMNRRAFIHHLPWLTAAPILLPRLFTPSLVKREYSRSFATRIDFPPVPFPEEKRVPLGITAFPVPVSARASPAVRLRFSETPFGSQPLYFRLTAAIDFREEKTIQLYLPQTGQEIGTLDIRYAHPFQPFQTPVDRRWLPDIHRQGLGLRMKKGHQTAWFFRPEALPPESDGLAPQLLAGAQPASEKEFLRTLYSMNSFSPFGWMGGCVQDALYELHRQGAPAATHTLKTHLNHYLDEQDVVFESPHTQPLDGTFNSIEDFLPLAAIASLYPDHPAIQKAIDFCLARRNAQGIIMSGKHLTTEGCYTVAYPLMVVARLRRDRELAQVALDQLRFRVRYLTDDSAIYQRATLAGEKGYRNWGRGAAWYLLGTVKTLLVLQDSSWTDLFGMEEVQQALASAVEIVGPWQNEEHLWYSFLDQPETGVDASASAGIAAAIAWGARIGLSPTPYRRRAKATYQSLGHYLTPDGFLTQVSQINRGGEALQKSGYRVISQFGMGLLAQLKVALEAY